ncbi:hypothetical protein ACWGJB_39275 [Streptomyces sp. NPDC054813]
MRLDNARQTGPIRTRRGLALLIASGAALGSLLLATVPAQANDTTKQVSADGQQISFATSDSSRDVSGDVTFVVNSDGNWSIEGSAHNSHLLVRTFRVFLPGTAFFAVECVTLAASHVRSQVQWAVAGSSTSPR